MKRIILSLALLIVLKFSGVAQNFSGYSSENYSGVNGVFFNPANVIDSRYRWDINLFSVNTTVTNDYATIKTSDLLKGNDTGNILQRKTTGNANVLGDIDIHGPSVMFKLGSKSSLALTTRGRAMFNFDNMPTSLLNTFSPDSTVNLPVTISADKFGMTAHLWAEFGLTYGRILNLTDKHTFRGGITLKYLAGVGGGYFNMSNFQATVKDSTGGNVLQNSTAQMKYGVGGFTDFNNIQVQFNGSGFGADLGFSYEYRPEGNHDINGSSHYKIKASLAVLDIGAIHYNSNPQYTGDYTLNTNLGTGDTLQLNRFSNLSSIDSFNSAVKGAEPKIHQNSTTSSYTMALPTSVTGAIDYDITGKLYINLAGLISVNKGSAKVEKTHVINYITLAPRYEVKSFAIAVPLTINEYSGFNAGVSLRMGPLFFGSGSILSTLLSGTTKQADFHFGLEFGSFEKNKKIKKKEAPVVPVAVVPTVKAKIVDTDGDGIADGEDKCPTIPGLAKYGGCPLTDLDSDGIGDADDKCPTVKGLAKYAGCPIPDTDSDGVNDEMDKCPTVYGSKNYNGCPAPDTDSDGVNDDSDRCPTIAGFARYHGCPIPDTDGDGVNDEMDKCPTVKGSPSNFGCPAIKKDIIQKVNIAAKNLQFKTGKSVILKVSYLQLNKVIAILKANPMLNLSISGYTDNVGSASKNLELSADRANAAKAYFVSHGISTDRITAEGFGPDNPIAPNTTAAGKAKNRRVEFKIQNY
jgi:outer membrane protein OmpA-like peptidoglycan-associated protein